MQTPTARCPSLGALLGALLVSLLLAGAALALLLPRLTGPARGGISAPIAPAPSFTLTDQLGRPVSDAELRGKVVVANFIYTTCTDICPALTAQMASLRTGLADEGLLGDDVVLLSISVDPARDTPTVLKAYSELFAADPASWHFLTGDETEVREVAVDGFMLGVEVMEAAAGGAASHSADVSHSGDHTGDHSDSYEVMHSGRLVVIDRGWQVPPTTTASSSTRRPCYSSSVCWLAAARRSASALTGRWRLRPLGLVELLTGAKVVV